MVLLALDASSVQAQVPQPRRPDAGSLFNQSMPSGVEPTLPGSSLPAVLDEKAEVAEKVGTLVKVSHFVIEGAERIPEAVLQAAVADLIGRELSLSQLRQAAGRLTAIYREQGYFLAWVYLPAQEVVDGSVRLVVLEGSYGKVESAGSERLATEHAAGILASNGVVEGEPIERGALERSLILIEQRSGAPAQATMQPGATVGTSHMVITAPAGPLVSGQIGADNFGNRYSGQNRVTAMFNLNSPRGVGDLASLWVMRSAESDAVFAAYQTPVGYSGLTLGASYSQFFYRLCCTYAPLEQSGYARVGGLQARYPLILSQRQIMNLGLSYEYKSLYDRAIVGELDDKTANVLSFSVDGLAAMSKGQSRYQAALVVGDLDIVGPLAYAKANAATVDTAGRYVKFRGEYQYQHYLDSGQRLLFRVSGQASDRNLDSSEKFILGGPNGVRAYPEGEAAGDQALLGRFDWIFPIPMTSLPGSLSTRLFADAGTVWLVRNTRGGLAANGIDNHYNLYGAGAGLTWSLPQGLTATLEVAAKIGSNDGASAKGKDADGRDSDARVWAGVNWAF